ncbi:MAG: 2-oxoacid:ferredoxin oxidoreductase subunit gamma [Phototrophicales bacterium]|nr:MAG: 2-oxoacid:ferredoxin oxidoreductase subunit gamma [Phototrophicales bacterium]
MQEEFVFSGFGGQGVMFAGQLLAYTAMDEGLEVTWIPSYGPEMRGGTAHCFVVISDRVIGSPLVAHPTNGIIFNKPSFDKYEPLVAKGGRLVVNTSLVTQKSLRDDIHVIEIPATDIAYEIGDQRLTNMVLLGALLRDHPILSLEALKQALEAHIPNHRRNLLEKNYQAIARGAERIYA